MKHVGRIASGALLAAFLVAGCDDELVRGASAVALDDRTDDDDGDDDGLPLEQAARTLVAPAPGVLSGGGQGEGVPDADLLVALVGDQGSGNKTKSVYGLVLDEGADLLLLLGDFDYKGDADHWAAEMEEVLGDAFPVVAVAGNHDTKAWKDYQAHLEGRLQKIQGAVCEGELGVDSSCRYRGLHFILSGMGTIGSKQQHEQYIADALAADDSLWSICAWHKTMRDLQAGDKPDEVSWKALQNCQDGGAIVAMAHEHSYARTLTLTALGDESKGHGAIGDPELVEVGAGRTFTVVSGLGGKSIRAYDAGLHDDDTWWATLYTSNYYRRNGVEMAEPSAQPGALFIRFHVDGDPKQARAYFKTIEGDVIDEFDIVHE